jgi:hypothetical protein
MRCVAERETFVGSSPTPQRLLAATGPLTTAEQYGRGSKSDSKASSCFEIACSQWALMAYHCGLPYGRHQWAPGHGTELTESFDPDFQLMYSPSHVLYTDTHPRKEEDSELHTCCALPD